MAGPEDQPGWWTFDPENGMWTVAGLPLGSTGVEAGPYVRWLSIHLDTIISHEWVADLVTDIPADPATGTPGQVSLATAVHRAAGAYQTTERPYLIDSTWLTRDARCPRCELRSLRADPPDIPGAPVIVTCISPTCAWTGTDEDLTPPDHAPHAPSPRRAS